MKRSFLILALVACGAGPGHAMAQTTPAVAQAPMPVSAFADLWAHLNDPYTEFLAAEVLARNPDIQAMAARLRETQSLTSVARSARRPQVDGRVTTSRGNDQVGTTDYEDLTRAGFEARWELDLSGRIQAGVTAAQAGVTRDTALYEDISHAVLARMTQTLVTVRKLAMQTQALSDSLAAQDDAIALLRVRQSAGLTQATRLELALSTRARTQGRLTALQAQRRDALIALEQITGVPVETLSVQLAASGDLGVPQADWVETIPLERLRYNPNVRAALAGISAADANLDAARAAQWPRLSLSAFVGVQDGSAGLRLAENPLASLAAGLTAPLFNAGRLKAEVSASDARRDQAVAAYEGRLREALADSATALNRFDRARDSRADAEAVATHDAATQRLAQKRADAGLTTVIEVAEAQDRLAQSRLEIAEATAAGHLAYIDLWRALGPKT